MPEPEILQSIIRFVEHPEESDFEALALTAFAYQYQNIEPFRRLCDRRGARPGAIDRWQNIPLVPSSAFKSLKLNAATPREIFRSSGTGGQRSVHYHPFPDLYRQVIDATFAASCLPLGVSRSRLPILSLIPTRQQQADSSLSFMADRILQSHGEAACATTAIGSSGVNVDVADRWVTRCSAGQRPVLILATAFALVEWIEALERGGLHHRLPPGSVVFETGGFKGRVKEISRDELVGRTVERLGVSTAHIVREYGMTELTSQLYSRILNGGDPDLLYGSPWMRVRLLDPVSLTEVPEGQQGLVAIFDLANLGSALHLLTEDVGIAEAGGLRLLGRAAGAELRGCSLTVEELAHLGS